jgi:hypothetical protein
VREVGFSPKPASTGQLAQARHDTQSFTSDRRSGASLLSVIVLVVMQLRRKAMSRASFGTSGRGNAAKDLAKNDGF